MADASEGDVDIKEAVLLALGDPAFWLLLAVNIVALVIVWRLKLELVGLILVYWMQSVVMGVTHVIRLRALPEAVRVKKTARDFGVVFGWLHFMVLFFILAVTRGRVGHPGGILLCAAAFVFLHVLELRRNLRSDAEEPPNVRLLAYLPFVRIGPALFLMGMGFLLLMADAIPLTAVAFGVVKTLTDAVTHVIEQYLTDRHSGSG